MPFFVWKSSIERRHGPDSELRNLFGSSFLTILPCSAHACVQQVEFRHFASPSLPIWLLSEVFQWVLIRIDLLGAVDEQLTLFFINLDSFLQNLERKCKKKTTTFFLWLHTACIVFVCTSCVCVGSLQVLQPPKKVQWHALFRLIGKSTLHVSVGAVRTKTRPGRAQSSPRDSWDRLQQPTETLSAGTSRYWKWMETRSKKHDVHFWSLIVHL